MSESGRQSPTVKTVNGRTYVVVQVPAEDPEQVRARDNAYLTFWDDEEDCGG